MNGKLYTDQLFEEVARLEKYLIGTKNLEGTMKESLKRASKKFKQAQKKLKVAVKILNNIRKGKGNIKWEEITEIRELEGAESDFREGMRDMNQWFGQGNIDQVLMQIRAVKGKMQQLSPQTK